MSVKVSAQDAAQNWVTGMGAAGPKYTAGVNAVKTAPGQLAAAAAPLWAANVAAAQPKFAKNVAAVTLPAWQNAATTKGAPRLASGATAAQPKMAAFMQSFIPVLTNAVNSLPPRGTYEQNTNRLMTLLNALHQTKGNY
jgi:hypothetical protein